MDAIPRKNPLGLRVWIRMQGPTGLPLYFDEPTAESAQWPSTEANIIQFISASGDWVATYMEDAVIRIEPIVPPKPEILRAESPSITN